MAGIGFRLQRLLSGESYTDLLKAYLYSSFVAAGPMLVVIGSLASVKSASQLYLSLEERELFMGLIIYAYALSMVGIGPLLYVVTRYLADKYYVKQMNAFVPTYVASLSIAFLLQGVIVAPLLLLLPLPVTIKWMAMSLYLVLTGIWMAMMVLSAARDYHWIFLAYLLGGGGGILGAIVSGRWYGLHGFLASFTVGQVATFFLLTWRIMREFGFVQAYDFGFLFYIRRYPYLVGVGLCYYLGIWIDKFLFWLSPEAEISAGMIRTFPNYDTPMFLAYLTVVPSLAFVLIQMETVFVRQYQTYYERIRRRAGWGQIRQAIEGIMTTLTRQFQQFVLFQGIVSGIVIVCIYQIAHAFDFNPQQLGIFRIGIVGSFLLMGFMMILLVLFYFDFQREAFLLSLLFCAANGILTALSLHIGLPAYGFGYAAACFLSVIVGFLVMDHKLRDLGYWTFMRQPIVIPQLKLETERDRQP